MAYLKGVQVKAFLLDSETTDELGNAEPTYSMVTLENVLIAPRETADNYNTQSLIGKIDGYTLAIPKAYSNLDFSRAEFEFWGKRWKIEGNPFRGIESMIPLDWNTKIHVVAYE